MIRWSSTTRLDDYVTVKALRRQVALIDKHSELNKKPLHEVNVELTGALCQEVIELNQTMRSFGLFSNTSSDLKKRVELMKRIRENLGDVFLYSIRVANAFDVDVSRSVHEKIHRALKNIEKPWKQQLLNSEEKDT